MSNDVRDRIVAWFDEHDDDGEFARLGHGHASSIIPPTADTRVVLYTTKRWSGISLLRQSDSRRLALFGGYGLPAEEPVSELCNSIDQHTFCFLGDADPVDLLVYAWLSTQFPIMHFGVNDALLATCDISLDDDMTIPLSESESAAMLLLNQIYPHLSDLVGERCAAILQRGRKIEVEAVLSSSMAAPTAVMDALIES